MFLIFGIAPRRSQIITVYDEFSKGYGIYFIANWFSLFFIPLIPFGKKYFIKVGSREIEITKQEYETMRDTSKVLQKFTAYSSRPSDQAFEETNQQSAECTNEYCPVCKKKLEKTFSYCPFCGQKQPQK